MAEFTSAKICTCVSFQVLLSFFSICQGRSAALRLAKFMRNELRMMITMLKVSMNAHLSTARRLAAEFMCRPERNRPVFTASHGLQHFPELMLHIMYQSQDTGGSATISTTAGLSELDSRSCMLLTQLSRSIEDDTIGCQQVEGAQNGNWLGDDQREDASPQVDHRNDGDKRGTYSGC